MGPEELDQTEVGKLLEHVGVVDRQQQRSISVTRALIVEKKQPVLNLLVFSGLCD